MSATEQSVWNARWNAAMEAQRPSVLYRPRLMADGTKWCALYGDDLATGVAGFGDTPAEAMHEFDKAWAAEKTPDSQRLMNAEAIVRHVDKRLSELENKS